MDFFLGCVYCFGVGCWENYLKYVGDYVGFVFGYVGE